MVVMMVTLMVGILTMTIEKYHLSCINIFIMSIVAIAIIILVVNNAI